MKCIKDVYKSESAYAFSIIILEDISAVITYPTSRDMSVKALKLSETVEPTPNLGSDRLASEKRPLQIHKTTFLR